MVYLTQSHQVNPLDDLAVMLILVQTLEATYSIVATGRKTGPYIISSGLLLLRHNNTSGTHLVEDVVIVTPHTTRILITVIRVREPLEGAGGPTKNREYERTGAVVECGKDAHILSGDLPSAHASSDQLRTSPLLLESARRNSGWQIGRPATQYP
jgi:hypothetical protein